VVGAGACPHRLLNRGLTRESLAHWADQIGWGPRGAVGNGRNVGGSLSEALNLTFLALFSLFLLLAVAVVFTRLSIYVAIPDGSLTECCSVMFRRRERGKEDGRGIWGIRLIFTAIGSDGSAVDGGASDLSGA
jgi:hypothetical protein